MILADEDVVTSKRPIIKVFHNLLNQNFVSSLSSLENNQQTENNTVCCKSDEVVRSRVTHGVAS